MSNKLTPPGLSKNVEGILAEARATHIVTGSELEALRLAVYTDDLKDINERQKRKLVQLRTVFQLICNTSGAREQNLQIMSALNVSLPMAKKLKKEAQFLFVAITETNKTIERSISKLQADEIIDLLMEQVINNLSPKQIPTDGEAIIGYDKFNPALVKMLLEFKKYKSSLTGEFVLDEDDEIAKLYEEMADRPLTVIATSNPEVLRKANDNVEEAVIDE